MTADPRTLPHLRAALGSALAVAEEAEATARTARAAATAARRELIEAEIAELVAAGWTRPSPRMPLVRLERGARFADVVAVYTAEECYYSWSIGEGTTSQRGTPLALDTMVEAADIARRALEAADVR